MQANEFNLDPKQIWILFKKVFWSDEPEIIDKVNKSDVFDNLDSRNTI